MVAPQSVRDGSDTGQPDSPDPSGCADGRHRLRVLGYVRGGSFTGVDCDKPLRVVCRGCEFTDVWPCSNHRASKCKPCAARYRRRVGRVAGSGTGRQAGYQYFLTLTAPSDPHCMKRGCSGDPLWCGHAECPCGVRGFDLARWNASHSKRWNHFRTALRRHSPSLEFFRAIEVQDGKRRLAGPGRGALHDHAMLWSPIPLSHRQIKALAMLCGFGHSVDLVDVQPGSKREAYYVSKYVSKATDQRSDVPWWGQTIEDVDQITGEISFGEGQVDARYRTWSMSRNWGLTMAAVKLEAREFVNVQQAALMVSNMSELMAALGAELIEAGPVTESPPLPL